MKGRQKDIHLPGGVLTPGFSRASSYESKRMLVAPERSLDGFCHPIYFFSRYISQSNDEHFIRKSYMLYIIAYYSDKTSTLNMRGVVKLHFNY